MGSISGTGGGTGLPPLIGLLNLPADGASGCAASIGSEFTSACGFPIDPADPAVAATAATNETGGVNAFSELSYNIELVGPIGATVPLMIGAIVATVATSTATEGTTEGVATLDIADTYLSPGVLLSGYSCAAIVYGQALGGCTSSILISTTLPVQSGDLLAVSLTTTALEQLTANGVNFASAFADPSFEIDPSFPLAKEFSIVLSPGIGNPVPSPSGVPEPTSLALLVTGLSGFAACRRRRHGDTDQHLEA